MNKLVINETAARMLGYVDNDDAIGEEIAVETTRRAHAGNRGSEGLSSASVE